jgi:flagellar basal-body rod protein FlgF
MLDGATYSLISKQIAVTNHLQVIENNVANNNTVGFKEDAMLFKQHMHRDVADKHVMTAPYTTVANFAPGGMKMTSQPLDCAIHGPGFFMIKMASGEIGYTRNGHFRRLQDGTLVTADGDVVLSLDGQEIVFAVDDLEPRIIGDGSIMVNGEERGRLGIVEFASTQDFKKLGNSLFTTKQAPLPEGVSSKVMQGMLEESNVNSLVQLTILANAQRDMSQVTHLVNEGYMLQRNAFKIYSKNGG